MPLDATRHPDAPRHATLTPDQSHASPVVLPCCQQVTTKKGHQMSTTTTVIRDRLAIRELRSARCDRCGAAAKAVATMPSGATLALCGHHTDTHAAALRAQHADVFRSDAMAG